MVNYFIFCYQCNRSLRQDDYIVNHSKFMQKTNPSYFGLKSLGLIFLKFYQLIMNLIKWTISMCLVQFLSKGLKVLEGEIISKTYGRLEAKTGKPN